MLKWLVFPCLFLFGGCVHQVKGSDMLIKIDRTPKCKVSVTMDKALVFEGTASKPCPKE